MASRVAQRARGMGAGMGGGGHANNPAFMFQADWQKKPYKAWTFVLLVAGFGTYVPYKCIMFAQRKAGVWK